MKRKIYVIFGIILVVVALAFLTTEKVEGYSVYTKVTLETLVCDFGTFHKDSIGRFTLKLTNKTEDPLLIYSIQKSSNAIIVDQSPQYFPKSKEIKIPLAYIADDNSIINETIIIKGNFPEKEIKIRVIGEIID